MNIQRLYQSHRYPVRDASPGRKIIRPQDTLSPIRSMNVVSVRECNRQRETFSTERYSLTGIVFYRAMIPSGLDIYSHEYARYCTTPTGSHLSVATSVYKYVTASRSGFVPRSNIEYS
ncbi:MAG: hypothetical protein LBE91_04830 [Tannerella sp.]|nr:hypothetical protein [Tannerella sp.]